jgi:glycosyltransferase involved in cell wall biosynthesis
MKRNKILVISYSNPDLVPTLINSVWLLGKEDFVCHLSCFFRGKNFHVDYGFEAKTFRLDHSTQEWPKLLHLKIMQRVYFLIRSILLFKENRYCLTIAHGYQSLYCALALKFLFKTKVMYYCPDVYPLNTVGLLDRFFKLIEKRFAKYVDFIWTPDNRKASFLFHDASLQEYPSVILNAQLKEFSSDIDSESQTHQLYNDLKEQGIYAEKVIIRAGAIGGDGGIETTIEALKSLPTNVVFVLCGNPQDEYRNYLKHYINDREMQKRVILFDSVPYDKWFSYIRASHVGHLLEDVSVGEAAKYNSPLAANRFFMYIRAGLPVLAPRDAEIMKAMSDDGQSCGYCVETSNVEMIKNALNDLLFNKEEFNKCSTKSLDLFNTKLNFEYQFRPALNWIENFEVKQNK